MTMSNILKAHYAATFRQFGATFQGVDWEGAGKARLRHPAMMRLIPANELEGHIHSLLDVGCGYGAFCEFLEEHEIKNVSYTGIDLVDDMVRPARRQLKHRTFLQGDVLESDLPDASYDYVIAKGSSLRSWWRPTLKWMSSSAAWSRSSSLCVGVAWRSMS